MGQKPERGIEKAKPHQYGIDVIAFGALRAFVDRGLSVPGDVSLVGFDDTSFSQFSVPRITTVRQSAELLGRRAAQILLDMADGGNATHELVPFELVERESVAYWGSDPF